jgi:hypothetical protein
MNGVILHDDFQRSFPGIAKGLRRAQEVFDNVQSFEDIRWSALAQSGGERRTENLLACLLGINLPV